MEQDKPFSHRMDPRLRDTLAVAGSAMAHPPARLSAQSEAGMVEEVHVFRKRLAEAATSRNAASLRNAYAERFVHTDPAGTREGRDARIACLGFGLSSWQV